jgi:hypothetical protein
MKTHVDMIPPDYQTRVRHRHSTKRWMQVTALLLAAMALVSIPLRMRVATLQAGNIRLAAVIEEGRGLNLDIAQREAELRAAYERYELCRRTTEEPDWAALLRTVAGAAGPQIWVSRLAIYTEAMPAARAAETKAGAVAKAGAQPTLKLALEAGATDAEAVVPFVSRLTESETLDACKLLTSADARLNGNAVKRFTLGGDVR